MSRVFAQVRSFAGKRVESADEKQLIERFSATARPRLLVVSRRIISLVEPMLGGRILSLDGTFLAIVEGIDNPETRGTPWANTKKRGSSICMKISTGCTAILKANILRGFNDFVIF